MKKRFPSNIFQSVILLFSGLLSASPFIFIENGIHLLSTSPTYSLLAFSFMGFSIFLIALLINRRRGFPINFNMRMLINRKLILILLTIIAYQLVIAPIISFLAFHFGTKHPTEIGQSLIYYLGAILCGPIVEEFTFRGVILNGMLENYKNGKKAILLSALIFGIIHIKILQVAPAFIWGLLFGYTFYKTRSIAVVILLHISVNFSGLINVWLRTSSQPFSICSAYGRYSWLVYITATIGLFIGCYLLVKKQMFVKYLEEYQPNSDNKQNHIVYK